MEHRTINVTEFKARCLRLLDEVGRGSTLTITRRGRPIATVGPVDQLPWKSLEGAWTRKVTLVRDLADTDTAELWDVTSGDGAAGG